MDNSKALSTLDIVKKRLRHIEQSIEAGVGSNIEKVFELMAARDVLEELNNIIDDESVCRESINKTDQLMEQLERMRKSKNSTAEL